MRGGGHSLAPGTWSGLRNVASENIWLRYPPVSQTLLQGPQEDEWKAVVINLSRPAVNSPESASEKSPSPSY